MFFNQPDRISSISNSIVLQKRKPKPKWRIKCEWFKNRKCWCSVFVRRKVNMAAASLENKIFFAGGNGGAGISYRIDIYGVRTNTWSAAQLSSKQTYVAAVAAGKKFSSQEA